jgi:hypothetical protein
VSGPTYLRGRLRFGGIVVATSATALVTCATGAAWPGPPTTSPPPHKKAPPPAWVETPKQSMWLAYGSYCWRTACADMAPPQSRRDLPHITVRRNQVVRIHLAFVPRDVHLTRFAGTRLTHTRLRPGRTLLWRARAGGVVSIDVHARLGSAGYLALLVVH